MPITKSAQKALRQNKTKRLINLKRSKSMKDLIKEYREFIDAKKIDDAKKILPLVYQAVDKAAKRGVIKKNNASRKKSRLTKLLGK
jgi:small subunit ribosomal protein S20